MSTKNDIAPQRIRLEKDGRDNGGPVVYWMSREQRVADNWSLLLAQKVALKNKRPLIVVFCIIPDYPNANIRHYGFMLEGLQEVEKNLRKLQIPFKLLQGNPTETLPRYTEKINGSFVITDFDPLNIKRAWQRDVASRIKGSFYVVDGHNIVPCWHVSPKLEYGAYTLRPKIRKMLPDFLKDFPKVRVHPLNGSKLTETPIDWQKHHRYVTDHSVSEVDWLTSGETAALNTVGGFIKNYLENYNRDRNDPNCDGQSNLSPYLHFGHVAPQRVALLVNKSKVSPEVKKTFLEEIIVRRELADNFCYYNDKYDSFEGFPEWARKTLDEHRADKRDYIYSQDAFEHSKTHDELWNAAQRQMTVKGKMHGYMRMYWAKKILEWSVGPEEAITTAIYLNDRYELDGRDPNGYSGIAWSIGGVHDRAWAARPIFGKIRYMSYAGCTRKFDVKKYIDKWNTT